MCWAALKGELDLRPPCSDEHFGSQQVETYVNMAWFLGKNTHPHTDSLFMIQSITAMDKNQLT